MQDTATQSSGPSGRIDADGFTNGHIPCAAVELRAPTEDDFAAVLSLMQACDVAVYGDSDWTPQELRDQWDEIDLSTDARIAEVDGRIAGVVHLCEVRDGRIVTDGYVHPELTARGVGAALLEAVEARARVLEPAIPVGERVYIETAHLVGDERAPRLLAGHGYETARTFFRMVVALGDEVAAPRWPEGIEQRAFSADRDGRVLHASFNEAFAAEWGHADRPYEVWAERCFGWHGFDPSLVVMAWNGEELAGFSLNYPKRMGDWGWIGSIGVLPSWRRRGLGLTLLQESFRRFRATGEGTVALGVDAENPTGATRLYERAGMHVLWRADVWQKELRPGA
jgi:mycothiol synthase